MKKLVAIIFLSATVLIGCSNNKVANLQEYYLELTNQNLNELDFNKVKDSLSNFKYENEVYELSKEEVSDGEKYDDISFHKFKDDITTLQICRNESTKSIDNISIKKEENNFSKDTIYAPTYMGGTINTNKIEDIKNITDNLNLNKSLQDTLNLSLNLMDKMNNEGYVTLDQAKDILKLNEYETYEDEEFKTTEYTFYTNNDYIWIDLTEESNKINNCTVRIDHENLKYSLYITCIDGKIIFSMSPIINDDIVEDKNTLEKLYKESNKEIFNLLFNNNEVNIYKKEVTQQDEKESKVLNGVVDTKNDRIMVQFSNKKTEQVYDYGESKSFKLFLNENQGLRLDVSFKDIKEINTPMSITLIDETNKEYIYVKDLKDINERSFITPKVNHNGDYVLSFDFKGSKDFTFDLYTINEE